MNRIAALLALALALATPASHGAYRCEKDGRITYQEAPCDAPGGARVEANPMNPTPEEAARARERAARDGAELRRIEKERAEAEKKRLAEERSGKRGSARKSKRDRCADLARKADELEESAALKPKDAKLQDKARRARRSHEKDCS